jgi:DNA-binding MarR family transcriptional regulator
MSDSATPVQAGDAVRRAIDLFPKLYYFMPLMRPQEVKVNRRKLKVKEPIGAILWLAELLAAEGNTSACVQSDLEKLVHWWYPQVGLSKALGTLRKAGLIEQERPPEGDRRTNLLSLTDKGKAILVLIKNEREETIRDLFQGVPEAALQHAVLIIEQLSQFTWSAMKARTGL